MRPFLAGKPYLTCRNGDNGHHDRTRDHDDQLDRRNFLRGQEYSAY
jgi:hypothetical protein